ncbi:hypothetical protein ACOMHN_058604 [Nucella lapillus]
MPTKITPLPKTCGGGGGGTGKGVAKTTSNTKAARKSKFFNSSHLTAATASLSVVTQNKGYLHAIIFTTCVGLGLLTLGAILVNIGDDKFIVDVMVLGGLCIVMATGSLVVGCIFFLRPVCKERKRRTTVSSAPVISALPPEPSPDAYFNAAFIMEDLSSQPPPDWGSSASVTSHLYDRESLGATEAPRGKLVPPSPPPIAEPSIYGRSTASTVLTTVAAESDEMSELSNDLQSVSAR